MRGAVGQAGGGLLGDEVDDGPLADQQGGRRLLAGAGQRAQQFPVVGRRDAAVPDGAGRGDGGQERITATGDADLANYFRGLADVLHYDFGVNNRISAHSDHFPFFLAGYPSATLNSADATAGMIGRGYGHTEGDTVDKVTLRGLQMGAAFAARVAIHLANADPFPADRRSEANVRQALDKAGMIHFLEHHWGRANRAV